MAPQTQSTPDGGITREKSGERWSVGWPTRGRPPGRGIFGLGDGLVTLTMTYYSVYCVQLNRQAT